MRTANPVLTEDTFGNVPPVALYGARVMTLEGTVTRTLLLLLVTIASATLTWQRAMVGDPALTIWMGIGVIGGLVVALATVLRKHWAPVTAPLFALLEGLFLGGLSGTLNLIFPGIAAQAVVLTFGTLFCLLLAYRSGLIRPSENFKLGVAAATGAVVMLYLTSFAMRLAGLQMPLLHDAGWMGIGISVVIVVIAALNLVLDFDFIEAGAEQGLPSYMEWYAGFGLLVTLVWLYVEILRLLVKLQSRE